MIGTTLLHGTLRGDRTAAANRSIFGFTIDWKEDRIIVSMVDGSTINQNHM